MLFRSRVAGLAELEFTVDDVVRAADEFADILEQVLRLVPRAGDGRPPPPAPPGSGRDDVVAAGLDPEAALAGAPASTGGWFAAPPVRSTR